MVQTCSSEDTMSRQDRQIKLDVVIPVYNEEQMVTALITALKDSFCTERLTRYGVAGVSFLFVNDGSTDKTVSLLQQHINDGIPGEIIMLSRNFGHQNAVSAGLMHSTGDVVAVIDADLQDPPELILDMVSRWREGYDVVYGQRRKRKESLFKKGAYWLFYRMISFLSETDIPLDAGDFSLMDRKVVDNMVALPEKLRFVRGLRTWVGFRQVGLQYDRPPRFAGKTKYSFSKLYKLATDGITSLSIRPLKIVQLITLGYSALLFALILIFIIVALTSGSSTISPWELLTYTLIVLGNATMSLCLYIISAYIGRGYLEGKSRPTFIVAGIIKKTPSNSSLDMSSRSDMP